MDLLPSFGCDMHVGHPLLTGPTPALHPLLLGVSAALFPQVTQPLSRTPDQEGSVGCYASYIIHCASDDMLPLPLPRAQPLMVSCSVARRTCTSVAL